MDFRSQESEDLSIISCCISDLKQSGKFSIDSLIEQCETAVTFAKLQKLKRPENRQEFKGRISDKDLRERLVHELRPFEYLDKKSTENLCVYANLDIPEEDFLADEDRQELAETAVAKSISISLCTPNMYETDINYWRESNPLLQAIYAPYCYRFIVRYPIEGDGNSCTFEEVIARVKEANEGDASLWFYAKLFRKREDAQIAGIGEPLYGDLQFTCGKTVTEPAYLCITSGKMRSDVVDFYNFEKSILDGYKANIPQGGNWSVSNSPNPPQSPSSKNTRQANPYRIRIYNTGQGNCIYLQPKKANSTHRFFFDVGATCDPSYQKADECRGEVKAAYRNIATCLPDFIILSHWHLDHYNLAYKFNVLSTCPWITPPIPSKFPKNGASILSFLRKNGLLHLIGSTNANQWMQNSGIVFCGNGTGKGCNNSGILIQMEQTLLAGDCIYEYWPAQFAAGKIFKYLVVPHHGSNFSRTPSQSSILPSRVAAVLDTAGAVYVCAGKNRWNHPKKEHMDALNKHLCMNTALKCPWENNPRIRVSQRVSVPSLKWDDT